MDVSNCLYVSVISSSWRHAIVCGAALWHFVRHVFYKAVLVFLSFSQKKTSGLVAHESST